MKTLRIIRFVMLGVAAALALGIVVLEFGRGGDVGTQAGAASESASTVPAGAASVPGSVSIGGPFHLTDDKGDAVTDATYRGRWMLVFFGYTNCPDECPLTLRKMATVLKDLGPLAAHVAPLFITVDPTRDTPDRLARYIENFDPRIIGLTGSSDQIAAVANSYRVYYSPEEHEKSGADLVGHSTFLYLMDPSGKFSAVFPQDVTTAKLVEALRTKLASRP